eukprot:TRINITY_DN13696_c0_g1_i1.p1 TRINITY_DN13696_c0_g1~~TRINITY_DN13696_c0_g1_i1.p1  ORF type:complete len:113 (+),score=10.83 TRINITY_DN13696_c0_g1_i1:84-422(+)
MQPVYSRNHERKTDMIARYGGVRVCDYPASTPHQDALALAEYIRSHLEDTPLVIGEKTIKLTVSTGVNTTTPNNNGSYMTFLDDVDKALYHAKHSGRNKVSSFLEIATREEK